MEFWAYPTADRASTPESTSGTSGNSGQRYAIYPNHGGYGPLSGPNVGAGVSVGTNGISVFEHTGNYIPSLLVYDAPIIGWTHVAVVYTNRQPRLYVNGSLVREHCADELLIYLAPKLLGDAQGMFNLPPLARLQDAAQFRWHEIRQIGDDLRLIARRNDA